MNLDEMDYLNRSTVGRKITRVFVIILAILLSLIANFYHLMLVINCIKPKNHDLTNIFLTKLH